MTNGYRNDQPIYCPVNCWTENDCPYAKDGLCHLDNPSAECDDFAFFFPTMEDWDAE